MTGALLGSVVDSSGTPQMGATVLLLNKYERQIAKTITAPDGRFAFGNLPADIYSIRVSLASFLPVSRDKVAVKAGVNSILQIHLATLFSTIEVSYSWPAGAMTDDWKWVLRSSPAIRPITRFIPGDLSEAKHSSMRPRIFSGTHAMVSVSGGEGGLIDSDSATSALGTGFALSTDVLGKNQLQLAGTFGQNGFAGPAAMGLCAIYSRNAEAGLLSTPPEITLTISQLGLGGPQSAGGQFTPGAGPGGSLPVLRTMSLSFYNVTDPLDNVHIEYGMTGESVDYLNHTSRVSPFARITVSAGAAGEVIAAYSDGGRPDELSAHQQYQASEVEPQSTDMLSAVNALARLPQLSMRDGALELQRTQNYELGYSKTSGARTYAMSAFFEDVSNGRLNLDGDLSPVDSSDLLSDGVSRTSTYNIGSYRRNGYVASVNQRVRDTLDFALAYGRMGGFTGDASGLWSDADSHDSSSQRRFLDRGSYNIASANVNAVSPVTGTRFSASYGWVDRGAIIPTHVFTTQNTYMSPGLNVLVRQPLPSFLGMPGRLELTADLRNMLAQGYIPMATGDGHRLLIVQAPRSIRGGLNFVF
ncbi:MAG TPA: carboxypeptidase-like regulatory domain-containing protein [Bryobacteraceae bacterium]|nr:carboxypeptidase-like regulatory domain-containing protein [Bryobacteraceae bacterium]